MYWGCHRRCSAWGKVLFCLRDVSKTIMAIAVVCFYTGLGKKGGEKSGVARNRTWVACWRLQIFYLLSFLLCKSKQLQYLHTRLHRTYLQSWLAQFSRMQTRFIPCSRTDGYYMVRSQHPNDACEVCVCHSIGMHVYFPRFSLDICTEWNFYLIHFRDMQIVFYEGGVFINSWGKARCPLYVVALGLDHQGSWEFLQRLLPLFCLFWKVGNLFTMAYWPGIPAMSPLLLGKAWV